MWRFMIILSLINLEIKKDRKKEHRTGDGTPATCVRAQLGARTLKGTSPRHQKEYARGSMGLGGYGSPGEVVRVRGTDSEA